MKKILLFCGSTLEEKEALYDFVLKYTDRNKDYLFLTEIDADLVLSNSPDEEDYERKRQKKEDMRWLQVRKMDIADEVWFIYKGTTSSEDWTPIQDMVRAKGLPWRTINMLVTSDSKIFV